ncbi:MAG TPA: chromate efflux transporter [Opitutaceae bacterium]|nr:chromate efflux transporter [Opitutaceae bacterium]
MARASLAEIAWAFFRLGCISFGGPVAHLGYLHEEFVRRRRWLTEEHYSDTVALCQFLPGPASSQVVFALGMHRGGILGAFLASACFTLPSAVLMVLFGYGVTAIGDLRHAGWLHGLKLAAVAVVAQAVWGMGKKLCPDRARITLALAAAGCLLMAPGALIQVGVIVAGAAIGWWIYRDEVNVSDPAAAGASGLARTHFWAAGVLACWILLLFALPVFATATGQRGVSLFDSFYRAGSLVFGGGHVVLPLLRAELVPTSWISDDAFLAGYGAAQAVPGPLFTFSAYLGTVIHGGTQAWLGGVLCLFAIFLPAWMLIGGALPFWQILRSRTWTQASLRGANAAVVGVLLAALYNPVWTGAVTGARDVAAAIVAFALLEIWRVPAWLVVVLTAVAGQAFGHGASFF